MPEELSLSELSEGMHGCTPYVSMEPEKADMEQNSVRIGIGIGIMG
jgi:hypothetical protein